MAQTLGEKLREAREERGISLSEVAEQTRISPYYIEAIERDDYKPLPGGIFNKGFIKSFAKFVGIDENEALADYLHAIASESPGSTDEPKSYKPEVLTGDSSSHSSMPTIVVALLILGAMTALILFGLNYFSDEPAQSNVANIANVSDATTATNTDAVNADVAAQSVTPDIATSKIEFISTQPVSLTATADGEVSNAVVAPGVASRFEPKQVLKLRYSRSLAEAVSLTINGKAISLPTRPADPKRSVIEFEINKDNFAGVFSSGSIAEASVPTNSTSNTDSANSVGTRPSSSPAMRTGNATAANVRPSPSPTRRTVVVGNAARSN